jgi:hypothetical protein
MRSRLRGRGFRRAEPEALGDTRAVGRVGLAEVLNLAALDGFRARRSGDRR